jgi:hypothetical protein
MLPRLARLVLWTLLILIFIYLYCYRLTLGVALNDEGYYANFPVTWLRTPPSQSCDLSLHQLSGLLTFPWVKLFHHFFPDLDGLVLFLRILYALSCLGTALALFRFLSLDLPTPAAVLVSMLPVVFIPFGLPAPSYNTIGMLCVTSGLGLFCLAIRRIAEKSEVRAGAFQIATYLALPSMLLAMAILAYPTLILLLFFFLLITIFFVRERKDRNVVWLFAVGCFLGIALASGLVLYVFGSERLVSMLQFHVKFGANLGTWSKVGIGWEQIRAAPGFVVLCTTGFMISLLAQILGWHVLRFVRLGAVLLGSFLILLLPHPVFYAPGHDLIFFIATCGLPTLLEIVRLSSLSLNRGIYVLLFATGVIGGLITSWTASNALFNFPIGGFIALIAALVLWILDINLSYPRLGGLVQNGFVGGMVACIAYASFHTVYGSYSEGASAQRVVIKEGPYAGLRTTSLTADFINEVERRLAKLSNEYRTVLILGRQPGLFLLTPLQARTPFSWPISPELSNGIAPLLENFYRKKENQADVVVVFMDQASEPLNSVEANLLGAHYQLFDKWCSVYFYRRTDQSSPLPIYFEFDQPVWGEGWSYPEKTVKGKSFIWMAAKEAILNFKAQAMSDTSIEFTVVGAMAPDILDSLRLQVNGRSVQLKSDNQWPGRTFWAIVPKEIIGKRDIMSLAFSVNRTEIPSGENRSLAIGFHQIAVCEAGRFDTKVIRTQRTEPN